MKVRCMKEGIITAILKIKDVLLWTVNGIENTVIYIAMLVISILTPYRDMISLVCVLSIADWVLAVVNAVRRENLQSAKMLKLVGKLIMYCLGFLMAGACKIFIDVAFFEWIFTTCILLGELVSLLSNMILVWPEAPVLRMLDKLLKSEMAAKLNLTKEDVETAIKESTTKRRKK